jgi:RNA polymerase sigma-70 factor (ECF subfamily)
MIFNIPGKKSPQRTDEELIAEFNSTGNLKVLGDLYSPYMHLVYGVCLKYLKDRDESKDAVIQIFEKIIIEIPKNDIGNFKGWLYAVTRNFCLMQLRSAKSRQERFNEWVNDDAVFMENSHDPHPIDEDDAVMEEDLAECIKRLKEEQKECIRLFYFENRCYNEISVILNIDEKKVKSHLQNAKRNLKLCLEEKDAGRE